MELVVVTVVSKIEEVKASSASEIKPEDGKDAKKEKKRKFMPLTTTAFRIVTLFNVLPFRWDSRAGKFSSKPQGAVRAVLNGFMLTCVTVDFGFTLARLVQLILNNWPIHKSGRMGDAILLFALLGPKFWTVVDTYQPLLSRYDLIGFTNQLFNLRRSEGLYRDLRGTKIYIFVSSFRTFQMIMACIFKPNRRQFWHSLLPEDWKTSFIYGIHVIFNIQTTLGLSISLFFAVQNMITYTNTLVILLRKPISPTDNIDQRLMSYRRLQLFAIYFEETYGFILRITRTYCLIMCVVLLVGCVRFYDELDLRIYLNMPITLFLTAAFAYVFYNPLGQHRGVSAEAIGKRFAKSDLSSSWCRNQRIKARLCARSSRAIFLRGVDRTVVMEMLRFVAGKAARLLIVIGAK